MGTIRYSSLAASTGLEQGRRDDLESLAFVIAYLSKRGNLPWMGVPGKNEAEKVKKIKELKEESSFETLFEGLPPEFAKFGIYSRLLQFEQRPDYEYCRKLFQQVLHRLGVPQDDTDFDWIVKREELIKQVAKEEEAEARRNRQSEDFEVTNVDSTPGLLSAGGGG